MSTKKGQKLNKTQRNVERVFSNPKDLEREERMSNRRERDGPGENDEEEEEDEGQGRNIRIENPNRPSAGGVAGKMKNMAIKGAKGGDEDEEEEEEEDAEPAALSRREREALQKQQAAARYQKLTEEGKTDQAKSDLARLALIRKQREQAKIKKDEEAAAQQSKKAESLAAGKSIIGKSLGKK